MSSWIVNDVWLIPTVPIIVALLILGFGKHVRLSAAMGAPGAAPRGVIIEDHVQANAQVEAIDYSARTVVLKGEGGRAIELKVGPGAKNFDQVKVGDNVKADFYRSTAIFLRKSSEAPAAAGASTARCSATGRALSFRSTATATRSRAAR